MICEHNFVTLEGDDWLCHDCELYFPQHPVDMIKAAIDRKEDERWDKFDEVHKGYEKDFVNHINRKETIGQLADQNQFGAAQQLWENGPMLNEEAMKKALGKFNDM